MSATQAGVERRMVESGEALLALRDDKDFHEGALSVLRYPTAQPVGYIGHEEFKAMTGKVIIPGPGVYVDKGPAGDFEVGKDA